MALPETEQFYPKSKAHWRQWLAKNHKEKDAIWVVFYKKKSGKDSLSWGDAVDEALCYGWIDAVKKKRDEQSTIQYFCKRKPTSTWSKINKEKVDMLIGNGKMTQAGLDCIALAQQNGTWTMIDSVEALEMPEDLAAALNAEGMEYFMSLSKSAKKMMLHWIVMAKRTETRQKRIDEIAAKAAAGKKPKGF